MTDREEFGKWWGEEPKESSLNISLADNFTMWMWKAWQARGELDAVRIKELEDRLQEVATDWQINQIKLDKAKIKAEAHEKWLAQLAAECSDPNQ